MFVLFENGIKNELLLKTNVKEWEYKLYGGRPELYPQDRRALMAMIQFRNERTKKDQNRMVKKQEVQKRLSQMRASGTGFIGQEGDEEQNG